MIELLRGIGLDALVLAGSGLVLFLCARVGNRLLSALPTTRGRATFHRVRPVLVVLLVIIWTVVALRWVLRSEPASSFFVVAIVSGVTIAATWRVIRDVVEGAFLRAANTLSEGDQVQVGNVRGRLQNVGVRGITIETTEGKLAILPHSQVAQEAVLRSPSVDLTSFHVFRVPLPDDVALPEVKQRVREAAMLSHWSAVAQPPQCVATADGELEITVFSLDSDRVSEIERAVRVVMARAAR